MIHKLVEKTFHTKSRKYATFILPVAYLFVEFVLLGSCFLSLGHFGGCTLAVYLLYPSAAFMPEFYPVGMFLAIAVNILFYAGTGYLVDRFILPSRQ